MIQIKYGNSTIATLENNKTGTLKCGGKLMTDDITVNVAIPEYKGEVEDGANLITFTIAGDELETQTFQAENGMTWRQFISSEYNTNDAIYEEDDWIYIDGYYLAPDYLASTGVAPTDTIISGHTYYGFI